MPVVWHVLGNCCRGQFDVKACFCRADFYHKVIDPGSGKMLQLANQLLTVYVDGFFTHPASPIPVCRARSLLLSPFDPISYAVGLTLFRCFVFIAELG